MRCQVVEHIYSLVHIPNRQILINQAIIDAMIKSAKLGCSVSKYQLGKLFLSEEPFPKDVDYAIRWLEEAADEDNQYAEYFDQGKFERLRRITGYLVGTLDRWNDAKKAEEAND